MLPAAPVAVNADRMTPQQLHDALDAGYAEWQSGQVRPAAEVFAEFLEAHP